MAAELAPEARRADTGEQQGADLRGVVGLLQMTHVTVYLNALAQGAQGVLIQGATGGYDVLVREAEMIGLGLDLWQAVADDFKHVATFSQLALKAQHR